MNTLQENSGTFKVQDLVEELQIGIENLKPEPLFFKCSIYRVPEKIRCTKENAYTPQLVSIGPLHNRQHTHLVDMEETKKRYMKSFLGRISTEKRDKILAFIMKNEQEIRNCYVETSKLDSKEFVMMIMYDAIFIIELFLRSKSGRDRASDSLLAITAIRRTLCIDLELLENQLPYFVLEEMYKLANLVGRQIPCSFMELSRSFFGYFSKQSLAIPRGFTVKHFCTWRRNTLLEGYRSSVLESKGWITDLPSAVKLKESGVRFKSVEGECLLNIKFEPVKGLIPCFKKYELQIPRLEIFHSTERQLRNIVALEQCSFPLDTPVCNYIKIMDYLIDTEKDVDLLVGKGVISNHLGDNASVAKMFNRLTENIHLSISSSFKCCEDLKAHYNNPWNKRKATLKSVYFSNPWRGAGTLAAIALLLFTAIQTICSTMQVV
ncbi:putative UPF0481 protein At3g02645 [Mangifera indica]|uniref:putative UPF0481 protein At3g02645 n=1 Tax=Mangifera indica TaxID=29780 RepID=UPI001CFB3F07|nr:putative UPF0481 protein At3g02645 [Mangifera indica]